MIRFATAISLLLTCFTLAWGMSVHSVPYDSVHYEIFRDTVYDPTLPPVEVEYLTCSNFKQTTVGYQFILRGTEVDILDVVLYCDNPQETHKTIKPFSLHMGSRQERNRIDKVRIWNKFPFDTLSTSTDSLVIITDKGNITLYMGEEKRLEQALNKERSIFSRQNEELQNKNHKLLLWLCSVAGLFILFIFGALTANHLRNKRRNDSVADMVAMLEENEAKAKSLNNTIAKLFKHNFETLNKLCYEYYEKGDTQLLRKSIFSQIEKEILKFREPSEIASLEQDLNRYLNNIIVRVDEQMPGLTESERTLLIYLYSGFSARTICTICDIEIKTFYMRRYRLKNKLLASEAADKELF
ncbi:hypothetical protein, partial [Muribaculum intestinale]|uniref:hypothetical protein n=1 Tax=Muribaculum intestinale TaxID=1796646 RepID=UPI003EBD954C